MADPKTTRARSREKLSAETLNRIADAADRVDRGGEVVGRRQRGSRYEYIGIITAQGPPTQQFPLGLPDFCDARYWVRMVRLFVQQTALVCGSGEPMPEAPLAMPAPEPPMPSGERDQAPSESPLSTVRDPDLIDDRSMRFSATRRQDLLGEGSQDPPETDGSPQRDLRPLLTAWYNYQSSMAPWEPALNLSEVESNEHNLTAGTVVRVFQMTDAQGRAFLAFLPGGGVSTPATQMIEVRIHRAMDTLQDAEQYGDPLAREYWLAEGDYLLTFRLNENGQLPPVDPQTNYRPFTPVLPTRNQEVERFKHPDGSQIFNAESATQPVWYAEKIGMKWKLLRGDGERWGDPPDPATICRPNGNGNGEENGEE